MKKNSTILTLIIILFSLPGVAQDRLIRIDSTSIAMQLKDLPSFLYEKELKRLLVPQSTQFGVIRATFFKPESSLTYDSVSHQLVYTRAWESIYKATSEATTKNKKRGKNIVKVPRKHIHKYLAPGVLTHTLAITEEEAQKLKKMWTDAIQNAEDKEDFVLDGTIWDFFIGKQRAESYDPQNAVVMYANELMDSVFNEDRRQQHAQDSFMEKIKWKSKDSFEHISLTDTCQIQERYNGSGYPPPWETAKKFTLQGKRYYCCFFDVGSGQTIKLIEIFKQDEGHWEKVAEGKVIGPTFITADVDSYNNRIVFSKLFPRMDTYTSEIKSLEKVEEIGELFLSDL